MRNFTSMRYAARDVWAQFELLLLQQRVLFIKPAAHTTQAKLRMVVPKHLVEQALVKVHDGVAGAHLGKKLDSGGLARPKRCIVTAIDV